MPEIIIKRASEYVNKLRAIELQVDGKVIGAIHDGEEGKFQVVEGSHKLKAKIDWCSSPEISFNIADEEVLYFHLSSFKKIYRYIFALFIIAGVLFVVNVFFNLVLLINIIIGICGVALLLIIYMLTINRKNYLTLKLVDKS